MPLPFEPVRFRLGAKNLQRVLLVRPVTGGALYDAPSVGPNARFLLGCSDCPEMEFRVRFWWRERRSLSSVRRRDRHLVTNARPRARRGHDPETVHRLRARW